MEAKINKPWQLVLSLLLVANCMQHYCVHGNSKKAHCMYIFGDSLSANGNNNNLQTSAKSNYNPYGIDYEEGPSGRFCNGETEADIIARRVGISRRIRPYLNSSASDRAEAANHASAAAGILPETGTHRGENINFQRQIRNQRDIYNEIANRLRSYKKAEHYLGRCLYYIRIGTNDYLGNYFLSQFYNTSSQYTLDQYADLLINQLSGYLQDLHGIGAKKFAVYGIGDMGCIPYARARFGQNGGCYEQFNIAASIFNKKLEALLSRLNNMLRDSKFNYVDATAGANIIPPGFTVVNASCCLTVSNATCVPNSTPCPNRNEYRYWDGIHFTQAAYRDAAERSYPPINDLL
ncbi:hypothetical protein VNO78_03979 [Psophocarpus tetragonolobus]|uniref:Uncharacterized protein n=1 Tax=Psophocarpus tetragonolobus TaxID=3891 RepID=A0AAN9XW16_PSOTE